jgi:hypothetical protein
MEIDLTDFSADQYQALFDLLVLAMYADGHLTTVEDEQLQKLLTAMGHTEESDRQREFDAAVTRMRPFVQSIRKPRIKPYCWQRLSPVGVSRSRFMRRFNKL